MHDSGSPETKRPLAHLRFRNGRERPITVWTMLAVFTVAVMLTFGDNVRDARERAANDAVKPEIATAAIAGSDYAAAWMLVTYPLESIHYVDALADAGHPEGLWFRGAIQAHEGDGATGRANIERAARLGHPKAIQWLRDHPAPR